MRDVCEYLGLRDRRRTVGMSCGKGLRYRRRAEDVKMAEAMMEDDGDKVRVNGEAVEG